MKHNNETFSDVFSAATPKALAVVGYAASYGFYFWPQAN